MASVPRHPKVANVQAAEGARGLAEGLSGWPQAGCSEFMSGLVRAQGVRDREGAFSGGAGWDVEGSSFPVGAKKLQEEGEDIDDVQVNVEGSKYILLRAQRVAAVTHQQLGVECQEQCKHTRS